MAFRSKKHGWFWYAFWSLVACWIFYRFARSFLSGATATQRKEHKERRKLRKKKLDVWEELFI